MQLSDNLHCNDDFFLKYVKSWETYLDFSTFFFIFALYLKITNNNEKNN